MTRIIEVPKPVDQQYRIGGEHRFKQLFGQADSLRLQFSGSLHFCAVGVRARMQHHSIASLSRNAQAELQVYLQVAWHACPKEISINMMYPE